MCNDYFKTFNIDPAEFDADKYWHVETGVIPNFLFPKSMRVYEVEAGPLTLRMLAESAKAGRWLYD
ncbi:MAG: DUF1493 family protein [Rouxiella aceris]|uniref:DUF1493 family protein n=1 Tax=Rouxiella aceris TaxID=2703884 RepID=UPI002849F8C1|nr:DUF1493 family protein [Rouxiella aceris]MDR3431827.1 DUF1493 family protein [Rouxiella aceris]